MKRKLWILLAAIILLTALWCGTATADSSGTCGNDVTWTLNSAGTLTISGSGPMDNWMGLDSPFYNNASIHAIVVQNGVTSIGNFAFEKCPNLVSVDIASSVTSIGTCSFLDCHALAEVTLREGLVYINSNAFYACDALTAFEIPESVKTIYTGAFKNCTGLVDFSVNSIETSFFSDIFEGSSSNLKMHGWAGSTADFFALKKGIQFDAWSKSGSCGSNITWTLTRGGVLTLSGTGPMEDFQSTSPFKDLWQLIHKVVIEDGITTVGKNSFESCRRLKTADIANSVTEIRYGAFQCTCLIEIVLPDSVTTLGGYAFADNYQLTNIVLSSNLTAIPYGCFTYCIRLTDVTIPDGVKHVEWSSFARCSALTEMTIPASATAIGTEAFYGCRELRNVTIYNPDISFSNNAFINCASDLTIRGSASSTAQAYAEQNNINFEVIPCGKCGENICWILDDDGTLTICGTGPMADYNDQNRSPFYNNDSIRMVVIQSGVTTIGEHTFDYCDNLTSITIPDTVVSIGDYAFQYATGLTDIALPDGLNSIGEFAFTGCVSLNDIVLPNSLITLGEGAFFECSKLASVKLSTGLTAISDYAFGSCDILDGVFIPTGIREIGAYAFIDCAGLTYISIPNTVTTIGNYAFHGCTGLTSTRIGNGVTVIGNEVFKNCSALTGVDIYSHDAVFGTDVFKNCPTNLVISGYPQSTAQTYATQNGINFDFFANTGICGDNVIWSLNSTGSILTLSGSGATYNYSRFSNTNPSPFYNNTTIQAVHVGHDITAIGDSLFYGCSNLRSVDLRSGITRIGDFAFANCAFSEISIPLSVKTIGADAFINCTNLDGVSLPFDLTSIGSEAFCNCSSLTRITIPNGVTAVRYRTFQGCTTLNKVTIPDGVTIIEHEAFNNCSALTAITIPHKVTNVEAKAFQNCSSITKVSIPDSVTSLGNSAFSGCSNLNTASIFNGNVNFGSGIFSGCASGLKVRGLSGSTAEAYANANGHDFVPLAISGTCGQNATWVLDENTHTLTISGTGAITTYNDYTSSPFAQRGDINTVIIEPGITKIGNFAFHECTGLTSITIPEGVTEIGAAFQGCTALTDAVLPQSVRTIGYGAFMNCRSLVNTNMPAGVTSLASAVFSRCESLTSMTIPTAITTLPSIFQSCSSLESIIIPDNITSIEAGAFRYCSSLTSITIPASVTEIGMRVFSDCTELSEVIILSDDITLASSVFTDSPNVTLYGHAGSTTEAYANANNIPFIVMKSTVGQCGDNVTWSIDPATGVVTVTGTGPMWDYWWSRGPSPFDGDQSVTAAVIGEGVTSIGHWFFDNCHNLGSVSLPSTLDTIGEGAFYDTALTEITIPYRVQAVYGYTFAQCSQLKIIYGIPGSFAEVVARYYNIEFLEILLENSGSCGNGLTWALYEDGGMIISGEGPMDDYSDGTQPWNVLMNDIQTLTVKTGVTYIGDSAFDGADSLTAASLPDTLESIGDNAFRGSALTGISIPKNVLSIGSQAFADCSDLTNATINGFATTVGGDAFDGCAPGLTMHGYAHSPAAQYAAANGITFDSWATDYSGTCGEGITWTVDLATGTLTISGNGVIMDYPVDYPDWYELCSDINTLIIEDGVTGIGTYAFYQMPAITGVSIPSSLTSIDYAAFAFCGSLTSLNLPESVTYLGDGAFYANDTLVDVTILNREMTIGDDVFLNCPDSLTIHGYAGSTAETYAAANGIRFEMLDAPPAPDFYLPTGLTTIEEDAFYQIAARAVVIPDSVTEIIGNPFTESSVTTIYGKPGGVAEDFADTYGYAFVGISE